MNIQIFKPHSKKSATSLLFISLMLASVYTSVAPTNVNAVAAPSTCIAGAVPTTFGVVSQTVNVPVAGTYRVWSRIKAPNTTANSYYFKVDTGCNYNVGNATTMPANTWTWINYQDGSAATPIDIVLTAGSHTLTYTGKEADVQLDKVMLLGDLTCVPTGLGDNCAVNDVTAPVVAVTAPANGASVSGTSNITATATDTSGIAKVDFLVDSIVVGSDTTAPYSYAWNSTNVTNGAHGVQAKAFDAAGNVASSAAVSVTVSNSGTVPPTDPITPPQSGTTPFGGTPVSLPGRIEMENFDEGGPGVAYNDTDAVNTFGSTYRTGGVDVRDTPLASNTKVVSGAKVGEWLRFTVNAAQAGTYSVVLRSSNTGASGAIRIEHDGANMPTAAFTIPNTGSYDTFSNSAVGSMYLPAGLHDIKVLMTTASTSPSTDLGRLDYISFLSPVAPAGDITPPTVSISAPVNGASVTVGQDINITATAADNVSVTKVEFYDGAGLLATKTAAPYNHVLATTGTAPGIKSLTVKAYDAAGNVKTSTVVTVTVTAASTGVTLPGDANGDSRVNALDLSILISRDGQDFPAADFNGDGTVGAADLAILLSKWTW